MASGSGKRKRQGERRAVCQSYLVVVPPTIARRWRWHKIRVVVETATRAPGTAPVLVLAALLHAERVVAVKRKAHVARRPRRPRRPRRTCRPCPPWPCPTRASQLGRVLMPALMPEGRTSSKDHVTYHVTCRRHASRSMRHAACVAPPTLLPPCRAVGAIGSSAHSARRTTAADPSERAVAMAVAALAMAVASREHKHAMHVPHTRKAARAHGPRQLCPRLRTIRQRPYDISPLAATRTPAGTPAGAAAPPPPPHGPMPPPHRLATHRLRWAPMLRQYDAPQLGPPRRA